MVSPIPESALNPELLNPRASDHIQGYNYRYYHTFISEDMNGRLVRASVETIPPLFHTISGPQTEDLITICKNILIRYCCASTLQGAGALYAPALLRLDPRI